MLEKILFREYYTPNECIAWFLVHDVQKDLPFTINWIICWSIRCSWYRINKQLFEYHFIIIFSVGLLTDFSTPVNESVVNFITWMPDNHNAHTLPKYAQPKLVDIFEFSRLHVDASVYTRNRREQPNNAEI